MKIFFLLTVFISLSVTGLGVYLIAATAVDWSPSYISIAKLVIGSILAFVGATVVLAIVAVAASDKLNKHRMKNKSHKGGKK